MDEQTKLNRWLEAEFDGRDDEADALFGPVLKGVVRPAVAPAAFTARTLEAVGTAAARDARRARAIRRFGIPLASAAALVLAYLCSGLMMSAFSTIVVKALDLVIGSVVYVATTMRGGGDAWSVAGNLGRATAALLTSPSVTTTILTLQGMAVIALFALQRLLRSDRESWGNR
jgi:hypothetical protein